MTPDPLSPEVFDALMRRARPCPLAGAARLHDVCAGFSDEGLPLSFQIIGRAFDEAGVFATAGAYEAATAWRTRRPSMLDRSPSIQP